MPEFDVDGEEKVVTTQKLRPSDLRERVAVALFFCDYPYYGWDDWVKEEGKEPSLQEVYFRLADTALVATREHWGRAEEKLLERCRQSEDRALFTMATAFREAVSLVHIMNEPDA